MPKSPSTIDVVVGHNIFQLRRKMGISQTSLGERIGITFQQVQKYEKGINRITVGKLVEIADAFNVNIEDLLIGSSQARVGLAPLDGLATADVKLARAVAGVASPRVRQALRGLVHAIGLDEKAKD